MTAVSSDPPNLSIERPALYVVATPIGNLSDVSFHAVALLAAVDLVLVEDTRIARRLLQRYGIDVPTQVFHDHNEREISAGIVRRAREERLAIALISDAGTPLVSDPGYRLVAAAVDEGVIVRTVPGACAVMAALSIAGLATDRFVFEGFLPVRSAGRRNALAALAAEPRTLVFYEAPHRILATIDDMTTAFGVARRVAVARELTKLHETVYRGTFASVAAAMAADPNATRGEFVVVVEGAPADDSSEAERDALAMVEVLCRYVSRADAVKAAAEISGVKRNALYRLSHPDSAG
ncbi:MAG: 16S rRNA (cytidine(1402)-2'-O)-methyltransferase [Gammaproteobacteria bacterium]|jgi:16S rRNA (cytidine1402-2'-O)-methyltransferase